MKKLMLALCLLFALAFLLTACLAPSNDVGEDGGTPGPTEETPQDPTPEEPPHTHVFGEWSTTTAATCSKVGEQVRSCACGESETSPVAATGIHPYNAQKVCAQCGKTEEMLRVPGMVENSFSNQYGILYFEQKSGTIGYYEPKRGDVIFSRPHHPQNASSEVYSGIELSSHFVFDFYLPEDEDGAWSHSKLRIVDYGAASYEATATENGFTVKHKVQGQLVLPRVIERKTFEEKILRPMAEKLNPASRTYIKFRAYYNELFYATRLAGGETKFAEAIAALYPVVAEKNIDVYVLDYNVSAEQLLWLARVLMEHCPTYTYEDLLADHAFVRYTPAANAENPYAFELSVDFTLGENGLTITFTDPENVGLDTGMLEVVAVFPYLQSQNLPDVSIQCEIPEPAPEPEPEPTPTPTPTPEPEQPEQTE